MTVLTNAPYDDAQFEAIYEQYFGLLVQLAVHKFRVPDADAEALAHDVLFSYLKKAETIETLRPWLIGAICYASRHYWRLNGRTMAAECEFDFDGIDPASLDILDSLPNQIAAREALESLNPRDQQVLYMRYFEGRTVPEIAATLGVKSKYASKLITKCLRRAERLFNGKAKRKGRSQ
jgi:RNA polymerase sigma factor (sigma-70 family)